MIQNKNGIWLPDTGPTIFVKPTDQILSQRKLEGMKKLAEIKQWGLRNPTKFMERFIGVELLDVQNYTFMSSWDKMYALWLCTRNYGKALALDTPIPTPDGYKQMKDLEIGDDVFGDDGQPVKIINTSPIFYNHDCYKVVFEDGEEIVADADHLWEVKAKDHKPSTRVFNTEHLSKNYKHVRKDGKGIEYKYRVKLSRPVNYNPKNLPIHPYILGIWLGDGCSADGYITCHANDLKNMVNNIISCGYVIRSVVDDSSNNKRIRISDASNTPLVTLLRQNNLLNNKHIPVDYLFGSVEQRFQLLQGLMDTDGSVHKNLPQCEFCQVNSKIVDGMCLLLNSLSIKYTCSNKTIKQNGKTFLSTRINFYSSQENPCVKLKRKFDRLPKTTSNRQKYKSIVNIEKVGSVPTKCISVDNNSHLFLCGKYNTITHNSTLLALYYMTRGMLLNNCRCYICAGTSDQSIETFEKIVSIAKREIESFTGLTDVFRNEVVINMNNSDGFIRNPAGFTYRLYNGSFVKTLNSNVNAKRGKRAEAVCFDECGWLEEEVFSVIEPYTAQDKNFKMGGGIDVTTLPQELPNQLLYTSSASSIDSYFYAKYKEYSKAMMYGSKQHFVADVNCEIMFNATYRGKIYPVPLLTKEKVDNALKENKEKGLREYYNQFTSDGGADAIVKRASFTKNSYITPPLLFNDTNKKRFMLAYDPARSLDNSVVNIGEIYEHPEKGVKLRIVNLENFMDVGLRKKTPMRTPEQILHLKQLLLDYNGSAPDYDNIEKIYIDAGSGGGGVNIADFFMEDWYEEGHNGDPKFIHRGIIDKEYSEEYVKLFPNAIDKIRLLEPTKYKSIIYEALIEMMSQDLIDFPAEYDNKGFLTIIETDEKKRESIRNQILEENKDKNLSAYKLEQMINEQLEDSDIAETRTYKLSPDEEIALVQIDNMKEEVVNMVRKKRESGKDSFELTKEKQLKLHDDRAYTLALLAYGLQELRKENMLKNKTKRHSKIAEMLPIKTHVIRKTIG